MTDIKLHGFWYSPFSMRVKWTLKLKNIPYEDIEEDRFNMSAQLLQYNPVHKKTPVLVHDGKPICESMIIVEYIDQIWPQNPLRPTNAYEKALAVPAIASLVRCSNDIEKENAIEKIKEHLRVVEDQCFTEEKKFFGGDTINIVDIAFGSVVKFLVVLEDAFEVKILEYEKFPHFHSWYNNFKDAPVIKENLPDQDKMVTFLKFFREKILASS
uniref:glutathione transferase n=1 Tax=Cajanus cajan TaxID=3821 RepID=A0A151T0Z1_CAJCA|nr:putative glutathione S-transferase [Cajanus cajan]